MLIFIFSSMLLIAKAQSAFTPHFTEFLKSRPDRYGVLMNTADKYGDSGAFGGKLTATDIGQPGYYATIFVHGIAGSALFHAVPHATGWDKHIEYFKKLAYPAHLLYGVTVGNRDMNSAADSAPTCQDVLVIRRLIEAVLTYTLAPVNIIAHSTGVTLARAAIQGKATMNDCQLGTSVADRVLVFVGIAGANYGTCQCLRSSSQDKPLCSASSGFHPGSCGVEDEAASCAEASSRCDNLKYSQFLKRINDASAKDAEFVASLLSRDDRVVGCSAWGWKTSLIPRSNDVIEYENATHWEMKDDTIAKQYELIMDRPEYKTKKEKQAALSPTISPRVS